MQARHTDPPGLPAALLADAIRLLGRRKTLVLSGLAGLGKAWLAASLAGELPGPLLLVSESLESAERLVQDIAFFRPARPVHFFPHWETVPYDSFSPQGEGMVTRMQAARSLLEGERPLIVATAQALMQGMIPAEALRRLCFRVETGQTYPRQELLAKLSAAGYVRVDLVEAPGEFSSRGEIVDLFPPQLPHPVRLDFFDDELESMRLFDVESQTTFQPAEALIVFPASEVAVNPETARRALAQLPHHKSRMQPDSYRQIFGFLERCQPFPGCEQFLPLFYGEAGWLQDLLPDGTTVLLDAPDRLAQRVRDASGEVLQEYEVALEQGTMAVPPDTFYLSPEHWERRLASHQRIALEDLRVEGGGALVFPFADNHALRSLAASSQAGAKHALEGLTEHLRRWRHSGAQICLAARSQTGAERLKQVLAEFDLAAAIEPADPAALRALIAAPAAEGVQDIAILHAPLNQGLRVIDELGETRFALVTESELLGEKFRQRRVSKSKLQHFISSLGELKEGDVVVHVEYGLGRYEGLQRLRAADHEDDFLVITYAGGDKVYVPVYKFNQVQKYTGLEGVTPALSKLGDGSWHRTKQKARRQVEDLAQELVRIYAARRAKPGHASVPDEALMTAFEEAFAFQETEDQERAILDVLGDMKKDQPMDRLVCGDVGFGKTEVAMRAAFLAAQNGRQTLVLVPTTILAQQHYDTFRARFEGFAVIVEMLSRFRGPKQQKEILKRFQSGEVDILIGTHRLLSKDVQPKDLGLLVVDEEQRFGVVHKERIKQLRTQVDVLTLSATPIPRTLHMSLMGVRDLSIINTPPMDRIAIRTRIAKSSDYIVREAVMREVRRGGQVFAVHNRVETIHAFASYLQSVLPEAKMAIAHGQMAERELEQVMLRFVEGEVEVLVSTSIIESGLDIPRANTILIDHADHFGLAQLYQMRGRVGRSNVQAYAYLLVSPEKVLTDVAQKRLSLLQELNDLGSGFRIASHDLEIRGAGNLLGREQSGNINAVGLEFYTQMVEEAVAALKGEERKELERPDFKLDLGFSYLLPEDFIPATKQRLDLYKRLADAKTDDDVWLIRQTLEDRYGKIPDTVDHLLTLVRIRALAMSYRLIALERVQGELLAQFGEHHDVDVERLLALVNTPRSGLRLVPPDRISLGKLPATPSAVFDRLRQLDRVLATKAA
jgi:transcription-repair coupling factor (superfamily II helicase)